MRTAAARNALHSRVATLPLASMLLDDIRRHRAAVNRLTACSRKLRLVTAAQTKANFALKLRRPASPIRGYQLRFL